MQSDKISVVVPAYNIQNYIERCVESILAQTYRNLEIILVDDGSKDNTSEILDAFVNKDDRIQVIHTKNGGVTSARLTGIKVATGDWIGFVDGDDYIESDMFERLLRNAIEYGADISHCGYQMVFPSRVDYYYNTGCLALQDKITGLKDLLSGSFIEPGLWNKLFHKTLFHSLLHDEKMDLSIKNTEDLLMNYYLFKESRKSVYEDFCPYHYMVRRNSAANKTLNEHQLLDPIRVTKILIKEIENEELNGIIQRKYIRQLIGLATLDLKENQELIRTYRNKARKKIRKKLFSVLSSSSCGLKLKAMSLWVSIWPTSYRWVHALYARITGLDKIYEIS